MVQSHSKLQKNMYICRSIDYLISETHICFKNGVYKSILEYINENFWKQHILYETCQQNPWGFNQIRVPTSPSLQNAFNLSN